MSFEQDLIKEINELRTKPKEYAEKVVKNKSYFKENSNIWKHPDAKAGIKTEEGPAAYDECIDFLKNKAEAVEELTPSKGLNKIAIDFLAEFQKDVNADVEMDTVIDKHGKYTGSFRRLIEFGAFSPELVIVNLLVSDGDKTRGHRDALLDTKLKKVGVAHGEHNDYRFCSVIVACTTFENTIDGDDTA